MATQSAGPFGGKGIAQEVLAGGGETGSVMRALDWSKTQLGAIDTWPQSLRTALSICLNSRFPIAIYWGPDFLAVYNDGYAEILGGKHPWAIARSCREAWAEIWPVIGPMLEEVLATGQPTWRNDQLLIMERKGFREECYFSYSFSPIAIEGGKVGGVFKTVIETTERVIGERRLNLLRDLADQAPEAKTTDHACKNAARIFSGSPADVQFSLIYLMKPGEGSAELVSTSNIDRASLACPAVMNLGSTVQESWPFDLVLESGKAELVEDLEERFGTIQGGEWPESPRSALVVPIARAGQQRPYGFLVVGLNPRCVLTDSYRSFCRLVAGQIATAIANARAFEEERKRAEMLAELDRAKTVFFNNVGHEFRTPLTLILNPLDDLLKDDLLPEHRQTLQLMERNGLRLLKLVNTLLDFSRIEAGRADMSFEPTDLAAYTADLASMFRSAMDRAGLRFVVDCPPLPQPVYVDREMWEKILLNLLSNAFKFTFEGEVSVSMRPLSDRLEVIVRDTGGGIPAGEVRQIFQRFHRVRGVRARTQEGSGIGLALVQDLLHLHGGSVSVESQVGTGTTFTLSLQWGKDHLPAERIGTRHTLVSTYVGAAPYVEEALRWLPGPEEGERDHVEAGRPRQELSALPSRPALRTEDARILLVDDNADMRGYLQRQLSTIYSVEVCVDGQAALTAVKNRQPDLVLADVMMPRVDGIELVRRLRSNPETRTLPVILLSARAGEESTVEGLQAGADDYLVKPFSARELLSRISAQIQMSRLRTELAKEGERRRLAGELHDSVSQSLVFAHFMAEKVLEDWQQRPDAVAPTLERLCHVTNGAIAEMRVLLSDMRPAVLEKTSLGVLIARLTSAVESRVNAEVSVAVEDCYSLELPFEVRLAFYRVAQESLNNVIKHAHATRVEVRLMTTVNTGELHIIDNGRGFNADSVAPGIGLDNMRERAATIGAIHQVQTGPGRGTAVLFKWTSGQALSRAPFAVN